MIIKLSHILSWWDQDIYKIMSAILEQWMLSLPSPKHSAPGGRLSISWLLTWKYLVKKNHPTKVHRK